MDFELFSPARLQPWRLSASLAKSGLVLLDLHGQLPRPLWCKAVRLHLHALELRTELPFVLPAFTGMDSEHPLSATRCTACWRTTVSASLKSASASRCFARLNSAGHQACSACP